MAPTLSAKTKILTLESLLDRRAAARAEGLTVAHCHGCFDIVHPGHVRHLEFAASQADLLLVTLTGDEFIEKGPGRPLIPDALRAENLAALDCVDWVHVDDHATAERLLSAVQPDAYIKGREYESNRDPRFLAERAAVERAGGRVVFSSGDVVFSSTALIEVMANELDPFGRRLEQLEETHDLRPSALERIVDRFRSKRVVVVGEAVIDTYIHCEPPAVASEGPIMTLRPHGRQSFDGGAAIVARHLAALGAEVDFVTTLPTNDPASEGLMDRLESQGVRTHWVPTAQAIAEKHRYLVGRQKVLKVDHTSSLAIDERGRAAFLDLVADAAGDRRPADAVILCDYGLGLLTPATLDRLIARVRPRTPLLTGDVSGRRSNLLSLKSMDLVCPSETELRDAIGDYAEGLNAVAWKWLSATNSRRGLVTLGEDGVVAFSTLPDARADAGWRTRLQSDHVPCLGPPAIDSLGCGDALLATATLALASDAELVQAAYLGSLSASLEARIVGNHPISDAAIREEWKRLAGRRLLMAPAV
ncbi:MAG: PfkB family carbohydrate kinase [Phycisphaerales bacterium]